MDVLMLTQVLPYPPDSGPKVKTYHVIKYLAQHHRVTLISFVRGDQSEHVQHLKHYCHSVHTVPIHRSPLKDLWYLALSFLRKTPFLMVRDDCKAMRDLVYRVTAEQTFEIVHADQLNMAQYARRINGAFKVLDAHNALWLLYKRLWQTMSPGPKKLLLGRDWRLLKSYEGQLLREFDAILAVSSEDKTALQKAAERPVNATVIPIAIDTQEIQPVERDADANHILHIGTMYWPPNIDGVNWFINQVYPLVREQRPDVQFDIVGSNPPSDLLALNDAGLGVNVTGYVKDPTIYYKRAALMVVPLRAGGGMRVKILNALAAGIPIVSTTLGAEGILVNSGTDILLADEPTDFAAAVLRLLDDCALSSEISQNGRRLVNNLYDYHRACQPLKEVYDRAQRRTLSNTLPT